MNHLCSGAHFKLITPKGQSLPTIRKSLTTPPSLFNSKKIILITLELILNPHLV